LRGCGDQRTARGLYDTAGCLLGRLDGVARIGEKRATAGGRQQQRVAAGKAAEIADIRRGGDEEGVDLQIGEASGESVHGRLSGTAHSATNAHE
jgi:hypothetical protein